MGNKIIIPGANFAVNSLGHEGDGEYYLGDDYKLVGYYDHSTRRLVNYMPAGTQYYVSLVPVPPYSGRIKVVGMTPANVRFLTLFSTPPSYTEAGTELAYIDVSEMKETEEIRLPIGTRYVATGLVNSYEGYADEDSLVLFFTEGRRSLPDGYTELEYVNTNGRAYVDTGIPGNDSGLVFKIIARVNAFTQYGGLFGNYVGQSDNCWRIIQQQDNSGLFLNTNSIASRAGAALDRTLIPGTLLEIMLSYNELVVNGQKQDVNFNYIHSAGVENASNIVAGQSSAQSTDQNDIDIAGFSIGKDGAALINLIPVTRDSDDAVGFLDVVSGTFMPSDSATPFLAGPVV